MDEISLEMMQFAAKGYCCSQILMLLAMDLQDRENPDLVRAVQGLGMGIGCSGGACGAMTGGACLIALYAGKGADEEQPHEHLDVMLSELVDWFAERVGGQYGGINCSNIMGDDCGTPDPGRCGPIISEVYAKVMEILQEQEIDPSLPKGGGDA